VLDFDGDGRQDLYFVGSGAIPERTEAQAPGTSRLYRNLGGWRFEDVTERAGARGRGYMMGAVAGDYDNDGDQDLYLTSYGSNTLLRNRGDGTFEDATAAAGCDDPRWSTGAAFLDGDRDGDLDLYVQNYLAYRVELHEAQQQDGIGVYPAPDAYPAIASSYFVNRGDGTFEDASERSGIGRHLGRGLGVVAADLDDDGDQDLYVANDVVENFVFEGRGDGTFEEVGLRSGAGYSAEGKIESGMGTDAADVDGDGRLDLIVTNYQHETNAIYRGEGGLSFTEVSSASGTAEASLRSLGFGVRFADLDNDGNQDLFVANGHVMDTIASLEPDVTWAQPPLLFRGLGNGRFEDALASQPAEVREPRVARGLAAADLDDDGDLDLVLGILGGRPLVLHNDGGEARSWVSVRCVGTRRDSTAIGTRVTVVAGGKTQLGDVRSGGSYLSHSDLRVFFGLGSARQVERVAVRWPDGSVEEARDVPARRHLVFVEGSGLSR
jgi:hypothetical protein